MTGNPQSWLDLITMPTMDPRSLISTISFQGQLATFTRSPNWLQATAWVPPVIKVTPSGTPATTSNLMANNPQDFASIEAANTWNGTHAMTTINPQLPLVSEGLMYLRYGGNFINNIFFDFIGGASSTDIQIGFGDNSYTAGDFTAGPIGTIPVFAFPTSATYSGTGKMMAITLLQPGRYSMGLRIVDNSGNYSMFPMEWIVI